jgi:hypothetical protein
LAKRKPNAKSVTAVPCKCRFLERAAAEPKQAIVFDQDLNEYHIVNPGGGYWLIYHCPSCGGAAPASRRHELFATVTMAEEKRLRTLTGGLKTIQEAVAAFGKPQHDYAHGLRIHNPAKGKKPPEVRSYRTLRFTRLSEVADVTLTDYREEGIRFSFQGKYLGKSKGRPTRR